MNNDNEFHLIEFLFKGGDGIIYKLQDNSGEVYLLKLGFVSDTELNIIRNPMMGRYNINRVYNVYY